MMDIFEFVKSKVAILDVVSEYVTLKQTGSYWKGLSPFRNEKTPSFTVSPHREIYYCFSSNQGGDVVDFISKIENCTQLEAVHFLVDRFGLTLPEKIAYNAEQTAEHKDARQRHYATCLFFAEWCHQQLSKEVEAQKYFQRRNFTSTIFTQFLLGVCPTGSQTIKKLVAQAQKAGIFVQDFLDASLLAKGRSSLYSPFEGRIIFPIFDHLGRAIGFGGRIFLPDDDRPKYYNSKDHRYFNKSSILFGLDKAKKAIQQHNTVYLVEGYTDCISMTQKGYTNVVATLGTACTPEHLHILSRYANKLFIVYDADIAGKKAIMRLCDMCWSIHLELTVIPLPAGSDPASYLEKCDTLPMPQDIFVFLLEQLGKNFLNKADTEKLAELQELLTIVNKVKDPVYQHMILHKFSVTLDIPFTTLKQSLERSPLSPIHTSSTMQKPLVDEEVPDFPVLEKKIFSSILELKGQVPEDDKNFLITYLSKPLSTYLFFLQNNAFNFSHLYTSLEPKEKKILGKTILMLNNEEKGPSIELFRALMKEFRRQHWRSIVKNVKIKLTKAQKNGDHKQAKQILEEFNKLKKQVLREDYDDKENQK